MSKSDAPLFEDPTSCSHVPLNTTEAVSCPVVELEDTDEAFSTGTSELWSAWMHVQEDVERDECGKSDAGV